MNRTIWELIFCCGLFAAASFSSTAAPLQRTDVPSAFSWVLHIDCDGLRPTQLGQFLITEMEKPEAQAKFAAFQTVFNFDPRKQLHGVTLYSAGSSPKDGVLIVYAEFEPERLATLAKAAKEYQSTEHRQHVIHSWVDVHKKDKPRVYAAIQGNRVIFGQRDAAVAAALDVVDGAVANLNTSKTFPFLGVAGRSTFIQATARKLDLPDKDPNAAVFRLSKLVRFELGESQNQVTATLNLEANTEDVAQNIASIANGLVALVKLQKEKPEALKIAEALSLKQEASSVVSSLTLPASDVIQMIQADAARKAAKKARKQ